MSETGLSEIHKIVVTVMNRSYCKLEPKVVNPRKYEDFRKKYKFREVELFMRKNIMKNQFKNNEQSETFFRDYRKTIDSFVPW